MGAEECLPDTVCAHAAEKSSIYTYPAAVLPILNPLMKALAYLFPDKGVRQVTTPHPAGCISLLLHAHIHWNRSKFGLKVAVCLCVPLDGVISLGTGTA
jgi:hypothetical protein